MYDIAEELGYSGRYILFWKQYGRRFSVKHLRTDSDIIDMMPSMTKNRQINVYLEEEVTEVRTETGDATRDITEEATVDVPGDATEEACGDATSDLHEEATADVTGDAIEEASGDDVTGEADDEVGGSCSEEDSDYVVDDVEDEDSGSEDYDSGFEDSENSGSDHEGYAHDVNVNNDFEMGLNNDLLGGCHIRVNDDDVNEGEKLHSASESNSDDKKKEGACKNGYKSGCRPIISIDGYHLKGYFGGTFLAAFGVDAKDNIYPITYVVVEAKSQSSWDWFMSLLAVDLEIESNHNVTFISDKQKGLIEAMTQVFPSAEHRTCVRHLYSNFKNRENFKGKNLKDLLWKATRATYLKEFEDAMAELKAVSIQAFEWLNGKDPRQWSKSHFSPFCKSDMLLSNLSNCFNKMILEARDKPILTLMEMVRTKIMHKFAMKEQEADKFTGILCPKIQKKVELTIQQSTRCWATHAGGHKYQLSAGPSNQHVVDLEHHSCSCRK
ncbi:hypothetical protein V6N13_148873 [Hibiscus sabdariffa]